MQNQPIGILDSGVGGLTIWDKIINLLPQESAIYIADSLNCPYGSKAEAEIYERSKKMTSFLLEKEAKLIVVACNTITVSCLDKLREKFANVPIVGIVPVVKTAAETTRNARIGVLSTTRTDKSVYQKNLIKKFAGDCQVFTHGTDDLVPLIEKGILKGEEIDLVLNIVLDKFKKEKIDTLALGCSHFPFLKKQIGKYFGSSVDVLDSSGAVARQVKRVLGKADLASEKKNQEYKFFTTGDKKILFDLSKKFGKNINTDDFFQINI